MDSISCKWFVLLNFDYPRINVFIEDRVFMKESRLSLLLLKNKDFKTGVMIGN